MGDQTQTEEESRNERGRIVLRTLLYFAAILFFVVVWGMVWGLVQGELRAGLTAGLILVMTAFFYILPAIFLLGVAGLIAFFTAKRDVRAGLAAAVVVALPTAVVLGLILNEAITG